MANQSDTRQKLIAKIHIGKVQLGMDDTTYRAMLMRVTSKQSCAKMNEAELARVAQELARLGFGHSLGKTPLRRADATPMMRKIAALLNETGKTWNYAHGIAKKMFGVENVNRLDNDQLHRVVAALQYHAQRQEKETANG
ncbi:regulatory protein GemA [Conchiformibius steedae DSM 2580]|uniref:Regulatory protein GemA n=1 Tax=Conchiformibius steedae DSM 2580 TaxID=1121352 RepID=A0AAE9HXC9_9NEIS|nr:regulatory protein GemA [Conchiformibius steedae]QMT33474.1 regulatory protein GemA [Conchiformibius steedae]URD68130.1 regulatory protein GemA [Conchiformibius steedae DSM 2580]